MTTLSPRTRRSRLAAAGLAVVVSACAPGINVETDFDPQQAPKIAQWKTYNWLSPKQGGGGQDTKTQSDLLGSRIKRAVDADLAAKGYRLDEANPDFMVGWHASIEGKMDVQNMNTYYGYGWGPYGYNHTSVREYDEGTLIIDVVDPGAKELTWRGVGKGEITKNMEPEERERRVNEAVARILEKFPPPQPKK